MMRRDFLKAGAFGLAAASWPRLRAAPMPHPQSPRLPPRIPRVAAELALSDLSRIDDPAIRFQRRYIWCPAGWSNDPAIIASAVKTEYCAAVVALNTAVAQNSVDYLPQPLFGGALIPVDLATLCPDPHDLEHAIDVWNSLSDAEPYFHAHLTTRFGDGKTYTVAIPAPHLGDAGPSLEALLGNDRPDWHSCCPIVRLDWFLWQSLSSIDGTKYLDFRGLAPGKTKLADYLKSRGIDERFIRGKNADERAAMVSKVTGRAREIDVETGQSIRPSTGFNIAFLTGDNFQGNVNPADNSFASFLDHRHDASEVITFLPSGWPEYTLWNGKDLLLDEADQKIVADHRIPEPFQRRLNGAISCIRCHGGTSGYMPVVNEEQVLLGDRGRVLADVNNRHDAADVTRIAALTTGDLKFQTSIGQARHQLDHRVFAATGFGCKEAFGIVAAIYGSHEYAPVDARLACKELGFETLPGDVTGAISFRKAGPAADPQGRYLDDHTAGRLASDYFDDELNVRVGLTVTRREWELFYCDGEDRGFAPDSRNDQGAFQMKRSNMFLATVPLTAYMLTIGLLWLFDWFYLRPINGAMNVAAFHWTADGSHLANELAARMVIQAVEILKLTAVAATWGLLAAAFVRELSNGRWLLLVGAGAAYAVFQLFEQNWLGLIPDPWQGNVIFWDFKHKVAELTGRTDFAAHLRAVMNQGALSWLELGPRRSAA